MNCKLCGVDINEHIAHSEINDEGDRLYVAVVDDKTPVILRKGDTLCTACEKKAIWYKRMSR